MSNYFNLNATNTVNGKTTFKTNASGNEGGEFIMTKAENSDLYSDICVDTFCNDFRIFTFTNDAPTSAKIFKIALADLKNGNNIALHTGNSKMIYVQSDEPTASSNALWIY